MERYPESGKGHNMEYNRTVKNMPESERPYEKCFSHGPGILSDAELLAVILKTGTNHLSAVDLAREVLKLGTDGEGICGLYRRTYQELTAIRGIGRVKAIQILCLGELAKRMAGSLAKTRLQFSSPQSVADYCMEEMRHLEREEVQVLFFDGKHGLLGKETVAVGTVNSAPSSPREVFLKALEARAVYIILIHNHPSGDPTPSRQDHLLTQRMQEAGQMIGIELSDHIIIGDQRYYSFREEGIL
jgi:DNA repair protein RadC